MSEPLSLEEFQALQAKEYSTYVANQVIYHGGARAYNPGDPVPVSNVEKHGYHTDGLVDPVTADTEAPTPQRPAFTPPAAPSIQNEG